MHLSGASRDNSTSVTARCTYSLGNFETSDTNNKIKEERKKDRKYFDRREKRLEITATTVKQILLT